MHIRVPAQLTVAQMANCLVLLVKLYLLPLAVLSRGRAPGAQQTMHAEQMCLAATHLQAHHTPRCSADKTRGPLEG